MMVLLELDPSVVRPGWTALIIVVLLAAAMVFLFLSMRKQFRKVNAHEYDKPSAARTAPRGGRTKR